MINYLDYDEAQTNMTLLAMNTGHAYMVETYDFGHYVTTSLSLVRELQQDKDIEIVRVHEISNPYLPGDERW